MYVVVLVVIVRAYSGTCYAIVDSNPCTGH